MFISKKLARVLALAAVVGAPLLVHAETTADITLSGSVASTSKLVIDSESGTGLNLDGIGEGSNVRSVKVAQFTMSTNNESGLTVTASSPTGLLEKAGATPIAFQVAIVAVDAPPADATYHAFPRSDTSMGAAGSEERDLLIRYTTANLQDHGEYGGSITLTVTDNS